LYALGEIVLVVIGILIALSINNWNETNKESKVEQNYLVNILNDLKDQNTSLEIQMANEKSYFEATSKLLKGYEANKDLVLDSTFFKTGSFLTARKTFVITDPTYTDLISSGNIILIKDIDFKNKLIEFYQELERIEKVIQNNNSFHVDQNYLSTYVKNGYYYQSDYISTYGNTTDIDEKMIIPSYETELQEISKKILSRDENKLTFINAIHMRHRIAVGHYILLKNIQVTTLALIKELEDLKKSE
jgi:hypothetical protein